MTKYYRPAAAIFEDSRFALWLGTLLNHLSALWKGDGYADVPKPPLWLRRLILISFPISYLLLSLAFAVVFVTFIIVGLLAMAGIGIVNFYRRRWE